MKGSIFYTFGNHMHWIDMEWMWGIGTLENSVMDMLDFVERTGAKGAVNFDAIGYEYLAWRFPGTFQRLREKILDKTLEISAGTYTQPYPLFIDEESNVQQIIFGVRACERLFGVRPKLFWEEEFYFFPQLPQLLKQAGYEVFCFFFQETWHTPYVPKLEEPTFVLEGVDGTRINAISFTDTCVHQWPEDMEKVLLKLREPSRKLFLIQWLELMNSPKWMCRSELIVRELQKLEQSFDVKKIVPSEIVEICKPSRVVAFKNSDIYHGLSVGKNGDVLRIERRKVENMLNDAQMLAAIGVVNGLSPQWSSYPNWEFEEARRFLMISQAHDIDECEGFCGDVGKFYLKTAGEMTKAIVDRYMKMYSQMVSREAEICVFNPLPWERGGYVFLEDTGQWVGVEKVPSLGVFGLKGRRNAPEIGIEKTEAGYLVKWKGTNWLVRPDATVQVELDGQTHLLNRLICEDHEVVPLKEPSLRKILPDLVEMETQVKVGPYKCQQNLRFGELNDFIEINCVIELLEKPRPGYTGALMVQTNLGSELKEIVYDYPFGVETALPSLTHYRYYPKGDWMTSEKFFEDVVNHFASLRFVEPHWESHKVLFLHQGNQGFIRDDSSVCAVLYLYDPWDGENYVKRVETRYGIAVDSEKDPLKVAQEFNRPLRAKRVTSISEAGMRTSFQPFRISGELQIAALYSEDNSLILRIWNPKNFESIVEIEPCFDHTSIERTTLFGKKLCDEGKTVKLKPFEIVTLRYRLPEKFEQGLDEYRYVWSEYQKRREQL
ncbi:MAG: hypothetical protein H5T94_01000 [Pseudothermotoga sp.]|nr:hypothetical protein [Pseudothermotoga sp.]